MLVVEDDQWTAAALRRGLEAEGYAVDVAVTNVPPPLHEVVKQPSALSIPSFLQNDWLGGQGTDTADWH